jgi:hypothetical protein
MLRFKTAVAVLLAVLAVLAVGAASASAKPQKLVLYSAEPETLVVPGDVFQMVLYHWSNSEGTGPNAFYVETSSGTVTCVGTEFPFSGLGGKDLTNSEAVDKVEINAPAGALAAGTKCGNTSPLGTEAELYVAPQNATLNLAGSKGKAELKAKSTTEPIYVEVFYSGGATCVYSATNWKGTLTFVEQGVWQQVVTTFTKVKVKLAKSFSSTVCDKKATISATFGFQNRGDFGGFGEGHFIFGKLV